MRLIELFWKNDRGTMAADVAKAGAAIAFLSVIAANFMSSRTPPSGQGPDGGRQPRCLQAADRSIR